MMQSQWFVVSQSPKVKRSSRRANRCSGEFVMNKSLTLRWEKMINREG